MLGETYPIRNFCTNYYYYFGWVLGTMTTVLFCECGVGHLSIPGNTSRFKKTGGPAILPCFVNFKLITSYKNNILKINNFRWGLFF